MADGYFADEAQAKVFGEELTWLLANQYGAFNSPVWFNLGLYHEYEIGKDSCKGNFYWDQEHDVVMRANSQYEYPPMFCLLHPARRRRHGLHHGFGQSRGHAL